VGFEVPETLLDLHPFPVEVYHEVVLQEFSVSHWNQQIPGLCIGRIIINNDLYRDSLVSVIKDILITKSLSGWCVELT
jgi:hypothetical protein